MWPLSAVVFAKAAIIASYLVPIAAMYEFLLSGRIIIAALMGCLVAAYLMFLKDTKGQKIFTVKKLEKIGPLYYFPLRLADELRA